MPKIELNTDDKPHLSKLMKDDPKQAKEIIGTFVQLMDEAVQHSWNELPQLFGDKLTFADIVKGVLHGALDLKSINPEAYDVFKEEVHPLAMLVPRKSALDGSARYFNWREWYRLDPATPISQHTVEEIIRKLLRYYKYVDVDALANALIYRQVKTFEGLGERNVKALPFFPALRYQQQVFGDLHVGKFFDAVGFLDCGEWNATEECPACQRKDIQRVGKYHYCLACNAGFVEVED